MKQRYKAFDGIDYMSKPFTLEDLQSGKIQFTSDAKIMQSTGFTHKGVEIFDKDIVRFTNANPGAKWRKHNGDKNYKDMLVSWHKERGGWYLYWKNTNGELCWQNLGKTLDDKHEVIGSAYEHPDLV